MFLLRLIFFYCTNSQIRGFAFEIANSSPIRTHPYPYTLQAAHAELTWLDKKEDEETGRYESIDR